VEPFVLRSPLACVSGREQEAVELLCMLDDMDWTLAEVDLAMTFPRVITDVLLAEWRAAELFDPRRLRGRLSGRVMLAEVDLSINYSSISNTGLATFELSDAILVSSQCRDGSQRPALDLDFPASLLKDDSGVLWLWLDPAGPALEYHGPDAIGWGDRAMAALGLVRCDAAPSGALCDMAPVGSLAASLAHGWGGSFETLLQTAESLEPEQRVSTPVGGVWYRVDGRAQLVPSTSWWHLYLDRPLDTGTYLAVVDALAGCGLLNPGFALAARERGFSCLRRPGLGKLTATFELLDVDDIPF
jgi:hypothetical protein